MPTNDTIKRRINKELNVINKIYHPEIPLYMIFSIVEKEGGTVVQEDGTRWSGFLCGDDSAATFEIAGRKFVLRVQWHRMPSGNYEITAYVS